MACLRTLLLLLAIAIQTGCASRYITQSERLQSQGQHEQAVERMREAERRFPDDVRVRATARRLQEESLDALIQAARQELAAGREAQADAMLLRALSIDARNDRALSLQEELRRTARARLAAERASELIAQGDLDRARQLVDQGLADLPRHRELLARRSEIEATEARRRETMEPQLGDRRPVSLSFREANLKMVLEAISRSTGVNFVLDRDVRPDTRATIFLRDAPVEDALDLLTSTNQLARKTLDPTTVLIYPNTPDKLKEYQDLVVRGFYLTNTDAKQAATLLRSVLKLRDVYVDERLNLIVIREPVATVRLAERLIAMQNLSDPEVMLEVEVLEVKRSRLLELGVKFPDSFSLTPLSRTGSTQLTLQDLQDLNSRSIGVGVPSTTVNLRREVGDASVLANPRIRARNRERARVMIGDKVPVITSTATSTGFVSESVTYIDVGLKLDVEPQIYLDDQVAIRVTLEVSSLTREIPLRSGLAYQIGTRNASTVLRLRDGETQLLAGLINSEDRSAASRLPGLGDLPVLGRLFSSQRDSSDRTEIVLSITPRLVRTLTRPDAFGTEFFSGTESTLRLRAPLSGAPGGAQRPRAEGETISAPAAAGASAAAGPVTAPAGNLPGTASAASASSAGGLAAPTDVSAVLTGPARSKVGEELTVALRVDASAELRGLPLVLGFDPAALEVVRVEEGSFFNADQGQTNFSSSVGAVEGRVVVGVLRSAATGMRGTGEVVRLTVKPKRAGRVEIGVASATLIGVPGTAPTLGPILPLRIEVQQ